jgi:hypothetical protein
MKTATILATLVSGAAAFAPQQKAASATSLAESPYAGDFGAMKPVRAKKSENSASRRYAIG